MQSGFNVITVTARDATGNTGTVTLTVTYTPPDTTAPTVAITSPPVNQWFSNALVTVQGIASDDTQVAAVWYQLSGAGWGLATGTILWTASVSAMPGTNTVMVYAVDTSGNKSQTNSVSFVYAASDRLLVRATGQGKLSPTYRPRIGLSSKSRR